MKAISQKGLNLIKHFEGFRSEAYLDPADIPTIGYGTTRYPSGKPVRTGDHVSREQAEEFLKHECDGIAPVLEKLVQVHVNQNQVDALFSFCYNLGTGALAESTLLKLLNGGDPQAAAGQFERWVNAVVHGVKTPLEGLVRRREAERSLFLSEEDLDEPIPADPGPQLMVDRLELFREGDKTVVAAMQGEHVLEIVVLERSWKDDLAAVLGQYPKASTVELAEPGKTLPAEPRTLFGGSPKPTPPADPVPDLPGLLARGSEGDFVRRLQMRLRDLGFDPGGIDGNFGRNTDDAVRAFQAQAFGSAEADGRVGPRTWGRLWGREAAPAPVPVPVPADPALQPARPAGGVAVAERPAPPPVAFQGTFLRLTKNGRRDSTGLFLLDLEYVKNGVVTDLLEVYSGSPSRQVFRTGVQSRQGSFEPLPEGRWRIEPIAWRDGSDNYDGHIWEAGIGPVSVPLVYVGPGHTARGNIEIHIDWNRAAAPGTAGCVGIRSRADYKRLVTWLRETDPQDLYVDWGLGTCAAPVALAAGTAAVAAVVAARPALGLAPLAGVPFPGAFYRKVTSSPDRRVAGIRGVGILPQVEFDPARQFVAREGRDYYTTGPLDRPSVYFGGHADGFEVDAGLCWDRVYDRAGQATLTDKANGCSGGDPAHTFVERNGAIFDGNGVVATVQAADLRPNFAFRPFWRTTNPDEPEHWHNPDKASAENVYFQPGEKFVMRIQVTQPNQLRMDIRPEPTQPGRHFTVSFRQQGFGIGEAQSFKRVNSIDQFTVVAGNRKGNERANVIPTGTQATGGKWEQVHLLAEDGSPARPMVGPDIQQIVGNDVFALAHRVFHVTGPTADGGETVDIDGRMV